MLGSFKSINMSPIFHLALKTLQLMTQAVFNLQSNVQVLDCVRVLAHVQVLDCVRVLEYVRLLAHVSLVDVDPHVRIIGRVRLLRVRVLANVHV